MEFLNNLRQNLIRNRLTRIGARSVLVPAAAVLTSLGFGCYSDSCAQVELLPRVKSSEATDSVTAAKSTAKSEPTQFLRVTRDDAGDPLAMQTAVTRYRPAKGELVVDLIGAVHIGEGEYYRQLNTQFELYDVVLYELVAPQGTRVPRGGKKAASGGPLDLVSWMQGQARTTLGLESQLELVDYQKSNFTHADLSPAEMGEKMAERGDTPLTVGLSALTEMMRQQNKATKKTSSKSEAGQLDSTNLLEMIGDPVKMKRMMASQFTDSGMLEMGLGQTLNQLLVVDRNAAAIKVLQQELALGKKKIAIFYGAAHMPDFEKQLVNDFGLKKTKQIWVDAWDLTSAGKPAGNSTSKMLFKLLNELSR